LKSTLSPVFSTKMACFEVDPVFWTRAKVESAPSKAGAENEENAHEAQR
jgi:hypothetical protein